MSSSGARTVAELVASSLVARKVDRVFGIQGSHVQPIWDELAQRGVNWLDDCSPDEILRIAGLQSSKFDWLST